MIIVKKTDNKKYMTRITREYRRSSILKIYLESVNLPTNVIENNERNLPEFTLTSTNSVGKNTAVTLTMKLHTIDLTCNISIATKFFSFMFSNSNPPTNANIFDSPPGRPKFDFDHNDTEEPTAKQRKIDRSNDSKANDVKVLSILKLAGCECFECRLNNKIQVNICCRKRKFSEIDAEVSKCSTYKVCDSQLNFDVKKYVACDKGKVGSGPNTQTVQTSLSTLSQSDDTLKIITKAQKSQWECFTCLAMNNDNRNNCICCQAEKLLKIKYYKNKPFVFNVVPNTTLKFGIDSNVDSNKNKSPEIKKIHEIVNTAENNNNVLNNTQRHIVTNLSQVYKENNSAANEEEILQNVSNFDFKEPPQLPLTLPEVPMQFAFSFTSEAQDKSSSFPIAMNSQMSNDASRISVMNATTVQRESNLNIFGTLSSTTSNVFTNLTQNTTERSTISHIPIFPTQNDNSWSVSQSNDNSGNVFMSNKSFINKNFCDQGQNNIGNNQQNPAPFENNAPNAFSGSLVNTASAVPMTSPFNNIDTWNTNQTQEVSKNIFPASNPPALASTTTFHFGAPKSTGVFGFGQGPTPNHQINNFSAMSSTVQAPVHFNMGTSSADTLAGRRIKKAARRVTKRQ